MAGPQALEIVEGPGAGKRFELSGPLELGRDPGLAVAIDDELVSRRHAVVKPDDSGAVVEDRESRNGTFVNDQAIAGRRRLVPGDRIRVGLTVIVLRAAGDHGAAARSTPRIADATDVLQPSRLGDLSRVREIPEVRQASPGPAGTRDQRYEALAALIDSRVKQQTGVAAFAFLGVAALAVILYFGLT